MSSMSIIVRLFHNFHLLVFVVRGRVTDGVQSHGETQVIAQHEAATEMVANSRGEDNYLGG